MPGRACVKNDLGETLDIEPADLLPGTDLYGQHEISEVARDRSMLTSVLSRYVPTDEGNTTATERIMANLRRTRESVLDISRDIDELEEKIEALPGLEETLRKYKALGLDRMLQDHTNLDAEKVLLDGVDETIQIVRDDVAAWRDDLPLDSSALNAKAVENCLPNYNSLTPRRPWIGSAKRSLRP